MSPNEHQSKAKRQTPRLTSPLINKFYYLLNSHKGGEGSLTFCGPLLPAKKDALTLCLGGALIMAKVVVGPPPLMPRMEISSPRGQEPLGEH